MNRQVGSAGEQGEGPHVLVTALGAYQYARGFLTGDSRRLLEALFCQESSPPLHAAWLGEMPTLSTEQAHSLVRQLAGQGLVSLSAHARSCPQGTMQHTLPQLLAALSEQQKAMLVDDAGFCIAQHGFSSLEEGVLPALASKVVGALQHAEQGILDVLGMPHGLPCLFDPERKTMVAFLDLQVAGAPFVLLISGRMRLGQKAFRDLIWVLGKRYGARK